MSRKHFFSIVFFICSYLLTFIPLSAQEEEGKKNKTNERIVEEKQALQDSTYQEPGTAFYLELGGKFFGSINVDFPIKKSNRISFGLLGIFPSFMYFYLSGDKNSRLEFGCGFTFIWLGPGGSGKPETPLLFHGVFGYRYQKKKGLLFRAGFTPMLTLGNDGGFVPWLGISLGYSL